MACVGAYKINYNWKNNHEQEQKYLQAFTQPNFITFGNVYTNPSVNPIRPIAESMFDPHFYMLK